MSRRSHPSFARVIPVRPGQLGFGSSRKAPGYPGLVGLTRFGPGQTGLVGSSRLNPGQPRSGQPESAGSSPEPVGSSHANPVFFSVHLNDPAHPHCTPGSNPMVNPHRNPGQPIKTRFDPIFSRLLSCTRSSVDTRRENRRLQTDPQWRSTVDSLAFRLPMHAKILALCSPSEVRVLSLTVTSHAVTLIRVSARTHGRMDAQAHHGSVQ